MGDYRGKYTTSGIERVGAKRSTAEKLVAKSILENTEKTDYGRVVFNDYKIKKDGTIYATDENINKIEFYYDDKISGKYILPNLYNLYISINREEQFNNKCQLIVSWCKKISFPYNLHHLYGLHDDFFNKKQKIELIKSLGKFNVNDFIKDLNNWGSRLELYIAIDNIINYDRIAEARNRIKHKNNYDYLNLIDNFNDEEAIDFVKNNVNVFYAGINVNMPPIKIRTYLENNEFKLYTINNSIFDVAYFALQRILCNVNIPVDNTKYILNKHTKMVQCPSCGDYFIKTNKRQIYCSKKECQRERIKINKRNFDSKKKDAKSKE